MNRAALSILLAAAMILTTGGLRGQSTETLDFTVYYELGFVNIELGTVHFETCDTVSGSNGYHLMRCHASTHSRFDWLYRVRDTFECAIGRDMRPLYYHSHSVEGSANDYSFYRYTHDSVYINVNNKGEAPLTDSLRIDSLTFDMLSTAYSFRFIGSQHAGDTIHRKAVFNGHISTLPIVFHGRERHKVLGETNHFSLKLESGSIFVNGRPIHIYTDLNQPATPLLIEADIPIGTITIKPKTN